MKHFRLTWLAAVAAIAFMHCGGGGSGNDAGTGGGAGGGVMDSGMGGGTGGGSMDAGTGGGGGSCLQVSFPPSSYRAANHAPQNGMNPPWNWALYAVPSQAANRFDVFGVELWFFGASANPTFPYVVMLGAANYKSCEVCLTYQEGCDGTGVNCANFFLAQSGSVTFTQADRMTPGQFKGSGSNVRFVEWDEINDAAKVNGRCVELASYELDASWPAPTPDGGSDGGVQDSGIADAGAEADAGIADGGADGG